MEKREIRRSPEGTVDPPGCQQLTKRAGFFETEYSEPEYVEETLLERIKNGFSDSIDWVKTLLQDMVVAVVAFAPTLVILIPAFIILWLIIRTIRKKRRRV